MSMAGEKRPSAIPGVIAWLVALTMFFPIAWMVLASFKTEVDAAATPPPLIFSPTLDNYRDIFDRADYLSYAINSVVISVAATIVMLMLAVPAAFAMSFYPGRRTRGTLLWMLSTKMLPGVGVLMPIYLLTKQANLLDTRTALVIVYVLSNLPIGIWMLFTFFRELPKDIIEASRIDGANVGQVIVNVLLPLVGPGIASTGLLSIILCWNEAFWSLNLSAHDAAPLTAFIASFSAPQGLFWAKLSAASTLAIAPILVFGWFSQKQLVRRSDVRRGEVSTELCRATLGALHPAIGVPNFDPGDVAPGIVHLGLGNFHRAHMARYTHALMQRDAANLQWGIVGAGLMAGDVRMAESLGPQDGLYTLVERSATGETASVIAALTGVIFAGADSTALLRAIDDPRVRIVSLTVTENGYCLNPSTRVLDVSHPLIRADLAEPHRPRSAIGIIVEAYRRRMAAGEAAFTALTCDNIQHNGDVLSAAVIALATLRDPALAAWIGAQASFPNTMVDRITPVTAPGDVAYLEQRYELSDRWPVMCEDFTQWVIEDRFVAGRPAWELDGAQFVPDVAPYEIMKLRLLNGSHLAIAALGRLMGLQYVHETMQHPRLRAYMAALMDRETGPTLPHVPGIDLAEYKRTLIARFANPAIRDTVERVNTDAPLNVLVVPIQARLDMGGSVDLLALALAAWMRRVAGTDEDGTAIEIRHPMAALLRERAHEGRDDPAPLLDIEALFGNLGADLRLVTPLRHWLVSLYDRGSHATLDRAAETLRF